MAAHAVHALSKCIQGKESNSKVERGEGLERFGEVSVSVAEKVNKCNDKFTMWAKTVKVVIIALKKWVILCEGNFFTTKLLALCIL